MRDGNPSAGPDGVARACPHPALHLPGGFRWWRKIRGSPQTFRGVVYRALGTPLSHEASDGETTVRDLDLDVRGKL